MLGPLFHSFLFPSHIVHLYGLYTSTLSILVIYSEASFCVGYYSMDLIWEGSTSTMMGLLMTACQ